MSDLPDYYAGGADVVLRPNWAAEEGTDINLFGSWLATGPNIDRILITQAIAAGKTLYITDYGVTLSLEAGYVIGWLVLASTGGIIGHGGGGSGWWNALGKQLPVEGPDTVTLHALHFAAGNDNLNGTIMGYEA